MFAVFGRDEVRISLDLAGALLAGAVECPPATRPGPETGTAGCYPRWTRGRPRQAERVDKARLRVTDTSRQQLHLPAQIYALGVEDGSAPSCRLHDHTIQHCREDRAPMIKRQRRPRFV